MSDVTFILLSTYNGASFLKQQLESIFAQSDKSWHLLWRDDGSNDDTVAVIEQFMQDTGVERYQRILEPKGNVGVAASFSALLRAVPRDAARVAFCDQDDVWLPQKLARASEALSAIPDTIPALYCARQLLVDHDLQSIGLSPNAPGPKELRNALVQNIATGNTVVLNYAAIDRLKESRIPADTMHDWWAYLVVTATDGKVIFDSSPVILYRQHIRNVIGSKQNWFSRIFNALRREPQRFLYSISANANALSLHPALTPAARTLLREFENLREKNFLTRFRAIRHMKLIRQNKLEEMMIIALIWAYGLRNDHSCPTEV
jgi:glycosyltransferase involved in cell wall biosynthesis